MNTKLRKIFLISLLLAITAVSAESYDFKNDYLYRDILLKYNILARNWGVLKKTALPLKFQNFKVATGDVFKDDKNRKIEGVLVPSEVIEFNKNGKYNFYWLKNELEVGDVGGEWRIENSMLIFSLSANYVSPYLENKELRYKIIGTNKLRTKLLLEGLKYPNCTGIIDTTSDPLEDFNKIIIAMEQKYVSSKYPEIIEAKELLLKKNLTENEK
jgi:hypothetical protein